MDGDLTNTYATIGILDSGVGGLSVLRAIHHRLPSHPTIYFADQKHLPYGSRDSAQIRGFVRGITDFLLDQGAAIIVIACNAASAASLHELRREYANVPFVGMEPAVKPAVAATRTGVVGVLTTQATANGALYRRVVERYAGDVQILTQVAPELVTIVEAQSIEPQLQYTAEAQAIIRDYVAPMVAAGADQIALACTHFPFLIDTIQAIVGPDIHLIDPGPAIARQVVRVLPEGVSISGAENCYFTSGSPDQLRQALRALIGVDVPVMAY